MRSVSCWTKPPQHCCSRFTIALRHERSICTYEDHRIAIKMKIYSMTASLSITAVFVIDLANKMHFKSECLWLVSSNTTTMQRCNDVFFFLSLSQYWLWPYGWGWLVAGIWWHLPIPVVYNNSFWLNDFGLTTTTPPIPLTSTGNKIKNCFWPCSDVYMVFLCTEAQIMGKISIRHHDWGFLLTLLNIVKAGTSYLSL